MWRVRRWIKVVAVALWLGLWLIQYTVVGQVARGELPRTEVRDGWVGLAASALGLWLLVFRPRVVVAGGTVEIRNPLRTWRFAAADVVDAGFHGFGLAFRLRDGRRPWTIVFQDTAVTTDAPRWADCVEAVTGVRPALDEPDEPHEPEDPDED